MTTKYNRQMFKQIHKVPSFIPEKHQPKFKKPNSLMFLCPDAVELVKQMKKYEGFRHDVHNASMETGGGRDEWAGTRSFPEAVRIMQHGSDKLKSIVTESNRIIKEKLKSEEFEQDYYRFDVQGEFFDVGEVLSGAPEPFLSSEKSYKNERHTDIVISNVHISDVDAGIVMDNAAKIIALVKMLEQRGVRTRINLITEENVDAEEGNRITHVFFPLKGYNEPFNYNKLSAYVHICFARRIMFKWQEVVNLVDYGYGRPVKSLGDDAIDMSKQQDLDSLIKKYYK